MQSITVSLTTTSRRIAQVHEVIATLLQQSIQPLRVVLWLSEEPYLLDDGVGRGDIPASLVELLGSRFEIRWTENLGPYRKLLPALKEFGGTLVTADDDTLYPPTWLAGLLHMNDAFPTSICCYRAHRVLINGFGQFADYWRWPAFKLDYPTLDCFPTGKDGVLYPSNSLHDDIFDRCFLALAPTGDDIWFKAMALRKGTPAIGVAGHSGFPMVTISRHIDGLYARYNLLGNDAMLAQVFAAYGLTPSSILTGRTAASHVAKREVALPVTS